LQHVFLKRLGIFPGRFLLRFQWQKKSRSKHRRVTRRANTCQQFSVGMQQNPMSVKLRGSP
jgi:hypothetical protein